MRALTPPPSLLTPECRISLLDPAVSLLYALLTVAAGVVPGPVPVQLCVAIASVTFAVRAALLPLAVRAFRGQRARTALAPQVEALRKKHPRDRTTFATEVKALHRTAGISPFAGLAPLLLSAVVTMTLYRMVSVLGSPLGTHWLPLLAAGGPAVAVLSGLLAGLLLVAWLTSRQQPAGGPAVLRLLPYGTVAFAALAPLAVSIYLLSSTAWTVAERTVLTRLA